MCLKEFCVYDLFNTVYAEVNGHHQNKSRYMDGKIYALKEKPIHLVVKYVCVCEILCEVIVVAVTKPSQYNDNNIQLYNRVQCVCVCI